MYGSSHVPASFLQILGDHHELRVRPHSYISGLAYMKCIYIFIEALTLLPVHEDMFSCFLHTTLYIYVSVTSKQPTGKTFSFWLAHCCDQKWYNSSDTLATAVGGGRCISYLDV